MKRTLIAGFLLLTLSLLSFSEKVDEGLISRWRFDSTQIQDRQVRNLSGGVPVRIEGNAHLQRTGDFEALLDDQEQQRLVLDYPQALPQLPREAITVEAWLAIEKTVEWGGILGIFPQGGETKGLLLGFKQSNFSFGLTSAGKPEPVEVRALPSLQWGQWYHVVGTYDGDSIRLYVNGEPAAESSAPEGPIAYPTQANFLLGEWINGSENLHWRGWFHEVSLYNRALSENEVRQNFTADRDRLPVTAELKAGPYLKRLDHKRLTVFWETEQPVPSILEFDPSLPLVKRYEDSAPKTKHELTVDGLERETIYHYRIRLIDSQGQETLTRLHEFDTTFDYTTPTAQPHTNPYPEDEWTPIYAQAAEQALRQLKTDQGYCLILGCGEGRLAYELAKRSRLRIIGIDENEENVNAARRALDRAGIYGVRVSVIQGSLSNLPYTNYFANLIVSDTLLRSGELNFSAEEMYRVLRPCGGVAWLGQPEALPADRKLTREQLQTWLQQADLPAGTFPETGGTWARLERPPLPDSGEWSHMYADMGNTACSLDAYPSDPLRILWFGEPGPRAMTDRGTRPTGPLSADGYLYVQGDGILFGIDAYNGTILWSLDIPNLRRANIPRDSGNMVAGDHHLYAVVDRSCWQLDAATGDLRQIFDLPAQDSPLRRDWGYIALHEGILYGSTVKEGGIFIGADGEWYDNPDYESYKVVSDSLFAIDTDTGSLKWTYSGKVIINSTICSGDGKFFFIESRSPAARAKNEGRLSNELLQDRWLVALDMETGKVLLEEPQEFTEGRWVFYMSYSQNTLIVLSTTDRYQLYAFDATSGEQLWQHEYPWYRDHHGGAMQHPVIIRDKVYAEPRIFDLRSGEMLEQTMPERNKCGTLSASAQTLFYRDFYHGYWDLEKNTRTHFVGVRPGCWLGIIPAGGIVLAPETSSGCYCAHPIQTSLAFIPVESLGPKSE